MSPVEIRLIGLLYLILSLLPLPFHIVVALAILRSKVTRNRPAYIIWEVRSVAEMGQLLIHALSGICALSGRELCEGIHLLLGNAIFFFWISTIFLQTLMCVNRFITFVASNFLTKNTVEMTYFLVTVCVIGAAFCMAGCSSDNMKFHLENMAWKTEKKTVFSVAIYYFQISCIIVGLICSAFVVLFLIDQKRKLPESRAPIKQTEVRVFIHSAVTFVLMATNIFLSYPLNLILNNEFQTGIILNTEWILICGISPFLAIAINREISKSVRELSILDSPTKVNAVSVAT